MNFIGWFIDNPVKVAVGIILLALFGTLAMFRMPAFVTRPDFALAGDLLAGATALALIGFLEAASIARTIAAKSGQRLDFNQEFIGQGASKVAGAVCSCFASSGSFTRSSVGISAEKELSHFWELGGGRSLAERVGRHLARQGPTLLVLDNFEQLVDHAPETVGAWLRQTRWSFRIRTIRSASAKRCGAGSRRRCLRTSRPRPRTVRTSNKKK